MFASFIAEKLEAYVYALIDPRTNLTFYIGKGRDNRVFSHAACALESPNTSYKYDTITEVVLRSDNGLVFTSRSYTALVKRPTCCAVY